MRGFLAATWFVMVGCSGDGDTDAEDGSPADTECTAGLNCAEVEPVFEEGDWELDVPLLGASFDARLEATDEGFEFTLEDDPSFPCTVEGSDFFCDEMEGTFTSPTSAEGVLESALLGTTDIELTYVGPG